MKYFTLFWHTLRFVLFSVKFFKNPLLQDKIASKDQKYFIYTFFLKYLVHAGSLSTNSISKKKFARAFGTRMTKI